MSQPNWTRPLALAVTLVVLGTAAYWVEFKQKPQKEETEEQGKKIAQIKDSQIQSITLSDGTGKTVSFNCLDYAAKLCKPGDNSKWELTEPTKLKADDSNVNSLTSTLNNLVASDSISLKEETPEKKIALLHEYGLDPAFVLTHREPEIKIVTSTGETGIYLGLQHPIGEGIFTVVEHTTGGQKLTGKFDQNMVYVLPSYTKANLQKDLTYWRDKKLMTISAHEVATFKLKNSKGEFEGTKKGGQWILTSKGVELPGDIESVDNLLTGATYLVAKSFVSDLKTDPKAKAFLKGAKPVVTLSLAKEGSTEPIVLTLYQKQKGKAAKNGAVQINLYATVSNMDPLYEMENYAKERLEKDLQDLRLSKLITSMDRFGAKRIQFSGADLKNPITLEMKDSKWLSTSDPKENIDSEKVQGDLDRLSANRVKEFIPFAKAPADVVKAESKALTFSIGDETSPTKRKIELWKISDHGSVKMYARDLNQPQKEILLMNSAFGEEFPWNRNVFINAGK